MDLRKAKSETLACLKKFVFIVTTPKKVRGEDAKKIRRELQDMRFGRGHSTEEERMPETSNQKRLAER